MNVLHPSDPNTFPDFAWDATPIAGDRFTVEQYEGLELYKRDQATKRFRGWGGATFTVVLKYDRPYTPGGSDYERRLECPLLHETDKARLILCPNGEKRWLKKRK